MAQYPDSSRIEALQLSKVGFYEFACRALFGIDVISLMIVSNFFMTYSISVCFYTRKIANSDVNNFCVQLRRFIFYMRFLIHGDISKLTHIFISIRNSTES